MSLRTRSTLAILALVLTAVLMAWVTAQLALRPFSRAVGEAMTMQAAFIGEQIDDGERIRRLERALGLEIERERRPPQVPLTKRIRGRQVWRWRGTTWVESEDHGVLRIQRKVDPERPARRIPVLLLFPALLIIVLAVWIADRALRPVEQATEAMERMAAGDLDHRLDDDGPSELARMARSFNSMTARVQRMLSSERELWAGLSHELRTPLTRIRLEMSLLEDRIPPERLARIEQDVDALDALIGEALELSRLQIGERQLHTEPIDIAALAGELRHPQLDVEGELTLQGDPRLLRRALQNLLDNAAKYAPGPVDIRLSDRGITVRDHGPGVPEAILGQLFEPFFRSDTQARGHGLGLMIVRQIAELHGARVRASNAEPGLAIHLEV